MLEHAALDQHAWATALGAPDGPALDPFQPTGASAGRVDRLVADGWTPPGRRHRCRRVSCPRARAACALDAAVHAWDVSAAVGAPSPLTDTAAVTMLDTARRIVEPLRAYGVYGVYAAALADWHQLGRPDVEN